MSYDEPKILSSQLNQICLKGADVGHAGPWYAYPGAEGVAATDLIAASLVEVAEGADTEATIKDLAEALRDLLGMK